MDFTIGFWPFLLKQFAVELRIGFDFVFKVLPDDTAFVYLWAVIGRMGLIFLAFFGPFSELKQKLDVRFGDGFKVACFALY